MKSLKSLISHISIRDFKSPTEVVHGYVIQLLTFGYVIYKYSSRSYESYGFLAPDAFNYHRWWLADLWPVPASHFSTFQFIYNIFPHPSVDIIALIQYAIIISGILGIFGIGPKICSGVIFLLASHLDGIMISADAETSGGSIMLATTLLFLFIPYKAFYHFRPKKQLSISLSKALVDTTTLVLSFQLIVGIFYFFAGINKIVDVGPHWPFTVRIDLLAESVKENQFLVTERYSWPLFVELNTSYILSTLSAFVALACELLALTFITVFRYKYIIVTLIIWMHIAIYLLMGINFIGNCFLVLGVLDWGSITRKATIIYDDECNFCRSSIKYTRHHIKPYSIIYRPLSTLGNHSKCALTNRISLRRTHAAMALVSSGDIMYGFNSVANLLLRSRFFLLGILMHMMPINFVGMILYKIIAKNRYLIAGRCDSGCSTDLRP